MRTPGLRSTLDLLSRLTVALWLGGLISLFLFVQSLFAADRAVAVVAAPVLFDAFGVYQLALGGLGVLVAAAAVAVDRASRRRWAVVNGLLGVALLGAGVMSAVVQPAMSRAHAAGDAATFGRLHGASMVVYLAETLAVLAAAVVLFTRWDRTEATAGPDSPTPLEPAARRTATTLGQASTSPASLAGRATAT